uniref:Uncharacterized protein n=1 Tax=Varanus komodoensis TaxID=61221 RepID=A0A8D2LU77_VARKO
SWIRSCSNNSDKNFDDEESIDRNRPFSVASAIKVPASEKPRDPSNTSKKSGSAGRPKVGGTTKGGEAGAVDEHDFIQAFTDVPTVQIFLRDALSCESFLKRKKI